MLVREYKNTKEFWEELISYFPESESKLFYDWRFTANQFVFTPTPWDPRPVFFFQLNTYGYSPYVTSSLTGGWVCNLQSSGPSPAGLMTIFLLSYIQDYPSLKGQVPAFIYPRSRVALLYTGYSMSVFDMTRTDKTSHPAVLLLLHVYSLAREGVYRGVAY
jgi:hypothetical protein